MCKSILLFITGLWVLTLNLTASDEVALKTDRVTRATRLITAGKVAEAATLLKKSNDLNKDEALLRLALSCRTNKYDSEAVKAVIKFASETKETDEAWYYLNCLSLLPQVFNFSEENFKLPEKELLNIGEKLKSRYVPSSNPGAVSRFSQGYINAHDLSHAFRNKGARGAFIIMGSKFSFNDDVGALKYLFQVLAYRKKESVEYLISKSIFDILFPAYMTQLKKELIKDKSLKEWLENAEKLEKQGNSLKAFISIYPLWKVKPTDYITAKYVAEDLRLWKNYQDGCRTSSSLPQGLNWQTSTSQLFADPNAKKGGTLHSTIDSFPKTLRQVGPDSNGSFRGVLDNNDLSLVTLNPDTGELLPSLATSWAIGADEKSVYYRLDTDARWSDGKPVTADDFLYMLYFYRCPYINAGWYNTYYKENVEKIVKYDDHTISIHHTVKKPNIVLSTSFGPKPSHYYGHLTADFTDKYDWKVVPNTGPYFLSKVDKGVSITLQRKTNWWAKDKKYFKNRFNPDTFEYSLRFDTGFNAFLKGDQDCWGLERKEATENTSLAELVEKGYIHRVTFHKHVPAPSMLLSLNKKNELLKNKDVREGLAHAFNIKAIIKGFQRKGTVRSNTVVENCGLFTNEKIKARRFDISKAKEFFKKAGFTTVGKDGVLLKGKTRLSFKLFLFPRFNKQCQVLKKYALKAGVELKLVSSKPGQIFTAMMNKQHDIAFHGWSACDLISGPQYWGIYGSGSANGSSNNFTATQSQELDQLIAAYSKSVNIAERQRLSREIQQWLHDDCAAIPLYHCPYVCTSFWRWVKFPKGYVKKKSYSLFGNGLYWIDQAVQKETMDGIKKSQTFPKVDVTIGKQ